MKTQKTETVVWGVAFALFVVGQLVLLIARARGSEPDPFGPELIASLAVTLVIAVLLCGVRVLQAAQLCAASKRFPLATLANVRKIGSVESDLWRLDGLHRRIPMFYVLVVSEAGIAGCAGAVHANELFSLPWSEVRDASVIRVRDGARDVPVLTVEVDVSGVRAALTFYVVGGALAGLLPKRGSPERELEVVNRYIQSARGA